MPRFSGNIHDFREILRNARVFAQNYSGARCNLFLCNSMNYGFGVHVDSVSSLMTSHVCVCLVQYPLHDLFIRKKVENGCCFVSADYYLCLWFVVRYS